MSHYDISYKGIERHLADGYAIADIIDYLGQERFELLREHAANPEVTCQNMNMTMGFAGVSGLPFHAFCRTFMLDRYLAWMTDPKDPVPCDKDGFQH